MKLPGRFKKIIDSIPHLQMFRADEQTGLFARQLVTETMAEIFRTEFPEARWANGELIPFDNSVSDGALEYSFNELTSVGRAKIVSDRATDIPEVETKGEQTTRAVKTVACKFSYSTQELRSAQLQGSFGIAEEKALSAREGHDFGLNDLVREGAPGQGLYGATNHPGIIVGTAITGTWATATAAQIVADFSAAANAIINESNGVETPNQAIFPVASYTRISTLKNSDSSDITVLQYLQQAFPWITNWTWDANMSTVGAGGTPAIVINKKDPTRMRVVQPMTLVPLPPQEKGLVFEVILESRFGGVMAPKPRATYRLEGI